MPSVSEVSIELTSSTDGPTLRLWVLPDQDPGAATLMDEQARPGSQDLYPVQLLEDSEYVFEVAGDRVPTPLTFQPQELVSREIASGLRGRIRTQSYVGVLPLAVICDGRIIGVATFEVRSRKLGYLAEYRQMLGDLSELALSLILERFAPTYQRLTDLWKESSQTAYERFLHVQAILRSPAFSQALQEVIARPYVEWPEREELTPPNRSVRPSSELARALTKPGPRVGWPAGPISSLPRLIAWHRSEPSIDNLPNQFVKYVLRRATSILVVMETLMSKDPGSGPATRGLRELSELKEIVDGFIALPFFLNVTDLRQIPWDNQVLLKREGYRELFECLLRLEVGLHLSWDAAAEFTGAQRKASTLYEYWAFLQLLRTVQSLCELGTDDDLVEIRDNEVTLSLRQGSEKHFSGMARRLGRELRLDLFYNRVFGKGPGHGSWTMSMRPDCSLRIALSGDGDRIPATWLHFDAKYRLSDTGLARELTADELDSPQPIRDDLLKMHVYVAAIRQTVGSYVLYPGDTSSDRAYREYRELLPGLGAFSLRPGEAQGYGLTALRSFLEDVLSHAAAVGTQERRHRYWQATTFNLDDPLALPTGWEPLAGVPPADTPTLLGFVRSADHLAWIHKEGFYNMRGDSDRPGAIAAKSPEAAAQVLVLYDASDLLEVWTLAGDIEFRTRETMYKSGYPNPRGNGYVLVRLHQPLYLLASSGVTPDGVRRVARSRSAFVGAPVVTTWSDLLAALPWR